MDVCWACNGTEKVIFDPLDKTKPIETHCTACVPKHNMLHNLVHPFQRKTPKQPKQPKMPAVQDIQGKQMEQMQGMLSQLMEQNQPKQPVKPKIVDAQTKQMAQMEGMLNQLMQRNHQKTRNPKVSTNVSTKKTPLLHKIPELPSQKYV